MSTIVSSFVKDRASAKQLATDTVIDGAIKAFIAYNGVSGATLVSMNITSVVDGAGSVTVNYTAPLAIHVAASGAAHYAGSFFAYISMTAGPTNVVAASYNIASPATQTDVSLMQIMVAGRLA